MVVVKFDIGEKLFEGDDGVAFMVSFFTKRTYQRLDRTLLINANL
jgi:hypothetical protein